MIRKIQFEEIPYEEIFEREEQGDLNDVAARLHIDPPLDDLDDALIERIRAIKGVGWVQDGIDYAAIHKICPNVILLESGCSAVWCEHMQRIVYAIVEAFKETSEVNYIGPAIRYHY